ncbi:ABC transporter substrate-binding protein, partial [candidate division KSB1 bacterium]|nr:ABC transporter substrate-binding protein [candidate division KSB1 bacterium]
MKAKHLLSVIIVIAVGIAFALHYLADSIFSSQPILGRAQIPNRIVSTSPAITEILFKLDVGDRIVGVTDYCTFPPKAQAIPKIGGIVKPSLETVLSLKPDLVMLGNLVAWMQPEFQRAQIPTLQLQMYTIPQILSSIDKLGEGVGVRDRAKELIETLEAEIKAAKTRVQDRRRKRAMIVVGRNLGTLSDIYVVGRESFLNDLLTFAGGENIFGSIPLQYPKVSKEEIIAR